MPNRLGLGLRPPLPSIGQGPSMSALAQQQQHQHQHHHQQQQHILHGGFAPPQPKATTLFIGSISGGITDSFLNMLLGVSGPPSLPFPSSPPFPPFVFPVSPHSVSARLTCICVCVCVRFFFQKCRDRPADQFLRSSDLSRQRISPRDSDLQSSRIQMVRCERWLCSITLSFQPWKMGA